MIKNKKVVAIIPARGGSKGILRKNIRKLNKKPLLAHTILAAKNSKLIDRVFVSTEDKEITEISKKYGAEVIERPLKLAKDFIITADVLKHAVKWLKNKENYKPDIIVYLQSTDIFRRKGIIDQTIKKLFENPSLDSVFIAYPTHKNYWQEIDERKKRIIKRKPMVRQKMKPIFREDTGLASAIWSKLIEKGERIGNKIEIIENDDSLSFIDIHEESDLWLAEIIIQGLKKINKLKNYEIF